MKIQLNKGTKLNFNSILWASYYSENMEDALKVSSRTIRRYKAYFRKLGIWNDSTGRIENKFIASGDFIQIDLTDLMVKHRLGLPVEAILILQRVKSFRNKNQPFIQSPKHAKQYLSMDVKTFRKYRDQLISFYSDLELIRHTSGNRELVEIVVNKKSFYRPQQTKVMVSKQEYDVCFG